MTGQAKVDLASFLEHYGEILDEELLRRVLAQIAAKLTGNESFELQVSVSEGTRDVASEMTCVILDFEKYIVDDAVDLQEFSKDYCDTALDPPLEACLVALAAKSVTGNVILEITLAVPSLGIHETTRFDFMCVEQYFV